MRRPLVVGLSFLIAALAALQAASVVAEPLIAWRLGLGLVAVLGHLIGAWGVGRIALWLWEAVPARHDAAGGDSVVGAGPNSAADRRVDDAFALVLGLGLLAVLGGVLAVVGWYRPQMLRVVSSICAASGVGLLWRWRRNRAAAITVGDRTLHRWLRPAVVVVAVATGLAALPPVTWLDALEYHLALPSAYLLEGALVELPHHFFSHLPHLLAFSHGFAIAWDRLAPLGLIGWALAAALLIGVGSLAEACLAGARWPAVALLVTAQVVARSAIVPGVDLYLAAAAVLALARYQRRPDSARTGLALLAAGLCVASKVHGLLTAAGIVVAMIASGGLTLRGRRLWLGAALALLLPAAFLVRSQLHHGTPLWPFFGGAATADWVEAVVAYTRRAGIDHGRWAELPAALGSYFFDRSGWNVAALAGLLLALVSARDVLASAPGRMVIGFTATVFLGWLLGARVDRYGIGVLAGVSVVAAVGWVRAIADAAGFRRSALRASLILPVWLGVSSAALDLEAGRDVFAYVAGHEDPASYLDRLTEHPAQAVVLRANAELPPDAVVVSFDEPRLYYLERRWRAASAFDPPLLRTLLQAHPERAPEESLAKGVEALGATHVLVNPAYGSFLASELPDLQRRDATEQQVLQAWLESNGSFLFGTERAAVFAIER